MAQSELEQIGYEQGMQDVMDKVFQVLSELRDSGDYHNETLDEIEWRLS